MELRRVLLSVDGRARDLFVRKNTTDYSVLEQIFIAHDYDLSRLRRFPDLLTILGEGRAEGRRPLIVDAGANIGMSTAYFASQLTDAVVVGVEPDPANYQMLVKNTEGLSVIAMPCALAARQGHLKVVDVGEGEWGFRTREWDGSAAGVAVASVTVSEIFDAMNDECFPFLVKIDIEGAEKELFSENIEWVHRTPLIIIELHDWLMPRELTSAPFLQTIAPLNRDFVYIGENVYSIANGVP